MLRFYFKPGVRLIATIAEKSVSDHSDQMDISLLTIPTMVTILAITIAGIGSGSIPVIASAIVWTHARSGLNDQNGRYISQGALQFRFI